MLIYRREALPRQNYSVEKKVQSHWNIWCILLPSCVAYAVFSSGNILCQVQFSPVDGIALNIMRTSRRSRHKVFGVCPFYLLNWSSLLNTHVLLEEIPYALNDLWYQNSFATPREMLCTYFAQWFMLTSQQQSTIYYRLYSPSKYTFFCIYLFNFQHQPASPL